MNFRSPKLSKLLKKWHFFEWFSNVVISDDEDGISFREEVALGWGHSLEAVVINVMCKWQQWLRMSSTSFSFWHERIPLAASKLIRIRKQYLSRLRWPLRLSKYALTRKYTKTFLDEKDLRVFMYSNSTCIKAGIICH